MRPATPEVAPVEVAGVATRGLPASGRPYLSVLAVKLRWHWRSSPGVTKENITRTDRIIKPVQEYFLYRFVSYLSRFPKGEGLAAIVGIHEAHTGQRRQHRTNLL